ncbi:MAG: alkaline phosphatase D family protein [Gemmataceae bacterium]
MRRLLLFCALLSLARPSWAGEKTPSRIGFGSCVHQDDPQPIWDAVVAAKPDLFILLGDNIYNDVYRAGVSRKLTIVDRYKTQAAVPGFKKLKETCPVIGTWDDHDYGKDDAGGDYPFKKENQQHFLDFFNVPKDSPRRTQEGVYSAEIYGPPERRVQVILLDTRYFRSPLVRRKVPPGTGPYVANNDPKATMLGEAQWKWLEEQLKVPAKVRLLGSSIQVVAEDHGWEKWMNLPHERERLYRLIRDTKAGGVISLSGDRHLAELSLMDAGIGYPLYDLTSSGFTMASKSWRFPEVNRHRVATMNFGNNFGFITIDWERKDPLISLQARDESGAIMLQQKIPLSLLQPGRIKSKAVVAAPRLDGKPISVDLIKDLVSKEVKLEMTVVATGGTKKGDLVFLNSDAERGPENFTVVIDKAGQESG